MEPIPPSFEYEHRELGEEIKFISGHYAFTSEETLSYQGRKVLYLVGYALMDNSCCGATGCGFAQVQGVVTRWRHSETADGSSLSEISPVLDATVQKELTRLIREKAFVQQVLYKTDGG